MNKYTGVTHGCHVSKPNEIEQFFEISFMSPRQPDDKETTKGFTTNASVTPLGYEFEMVWDDKAYQLSSIVREEIERGDLEPIEFDD